MAGLVGQKRSSAWGLYDLHGEVWEWCWDGYPADYYQQSPVGDPSGASVASDRMALGGSWNDYRRIARSAASHRICARWKW